MSLKLWKKFQKTAFIGSPSYIIHKNKISSVNKNRIVIGKKQIPIGETYRKNFKAIIEGR